MPILNRDREKLKTALTMLVNVSIAFSYQLPGRLEQNKVEVGEIKNLEPTI